MAKKVELKERDTNDTMYPVTTTDCVIKSDGSNISSDINKLSGIGSNVRIQSDAMIVLTDTIGYTFAVNTTPADMITIGTGSNIQKYISITDTASNFTISDKSKNTNITIGYGSEIGRNVSIGDNTNITTSAETVELKVDADANNNIKLSKGSILNGNVDDVNVKVLTNTPSREVLIEAKSNPNYLVFGGECNLVYVDLRVDNPLAANPKLICKINNVDYEVQLNPITS